MPRERSNGLRYRDYLCIFLTCLSSRLPCSVPSLLRLMRRKVLEGCSVGFCCPSNELGYPPRPPESARAGGRSLPKNYRALLISPWTVRLDWGRQLAASFGAEVVQYIAGHKPPDFVVDLQAGRQSETAKERYECGDILIVGWKAVLPSKNDKYTKDNCHRR